MRNSLRDSYEVRRRQISTILGLWNSRDPLSYADGLNLYQYVSGWPIVAVDPYGEEQVACPGFDLSNYEVTKEIPGDCEDASQAAENEALKMAWHTHSCQEQCTPPCFDGQCVMQVFNWSSSQEGTCMQKWLIMHDLSPIGVGSVWLPDYLVSDEAPPMMLVSSQLWSKVTMLVDVMVTCSVAPLSPLGGAVCTGGPATGTSTRWSAND